MTRYKPFSQHFWKLAHGRSLEIGPRSVIMGILNVTPDSFSDGGRHEDPVAAIAAAKRMIKAGAAIIDIGGESTRPGATPVTAALEQARVIPVIKALAWLPDVLISIDTWRAETADLAVSAGAHIVNDVWGLQKDPAMAAVIARHQAGCVIMHSGRERNKDGDVVADQIAYLSKSLQIAYAGNIAEEAIVIDPGFGFGKEPGENIELLARFGELMALEKPLLVGTSRKRFVGEMTGKGIRVRDNGTAATSVLCRMKGGAVFRVHDVSRNRDALAVADAVLTAGGSIAME